MESGKQAGIRNWTKASGIEPTVRVGIVLDEDSLTTIQLEIPDTHYALTGSGSNTVDLKNVRATATLNADKVTLTIGNETSQDDTVWRFVPQAKQTSQRGEGILVHDVVAGRGFHWFKQIDQTFCGTIELRAGKNGIVLINELPLEQYLMGVITAEMSGNCPADLLKTQCVVARSWLLALTEPKHDNDPFDRCNDDCCQRYQGTGDLSPAAADAVLSTRSLTLIAPDDSVVDANYSKSCGGVAELPESVWGIHKPGLTALFDGPKDSPDSRFFPVTDENLDEYLNGVWQKDTQIYCSPNVVPEEAFGKYLGRVDEAGSYFRWTVTLKREELETLIREKHPPAAGLCRLLGLEVTDRGKSGRASKLAVDFEDENGDKHKTIIETEYNIRNCMHPKFLYSSAFTINTDRDENGLPLSFTLRGAGWGHGAGMCQIGALGMALKGISYDKICIHYFPDARLEKVYD